MNTGLLDLKVWTTGWKITGLSYAAKQTLKFQYESRGLSVENERPETFEDISTSQRV